MTDRNYEADEERWNRKRTKTPLPSDQIPRRTVKTVATSQTGRIPELEPDLVEGLAAALHDVHEAVTAEVAETENESYVYEITDWPHDMPAVRTIFRETVTRLLREGKISHGPNTPRMAPVD
jgi:hypothetical protein